MKKVFLIPAADMDERAIEAIQLEGVEFVRIHLPPLTAASKLPAVLDHIEAQISDECPILVGFCSGGVLMVELGKRISAKQMIVVSGIRSRHVIILSRRILASLYCHLPVLLQRMIGKSLTFLLNSILRINIKVPRLWLKSGQNKFIVRHALALDHLGVRSQIFRIHGDQDRIVPLAHSQADHIIDGGGHFMFVHQRKEVLHAIALALGF